MKTAVTFSLAMSLLLAIAACSSHMNNPDIKQNPHPKMRHDVTITIEGAPGPFDSADGFMQYEVTNLACIPETGGPMNAMRIAPRAWPPITFHKVSGNVYQGTVYADYFQDGDYYGLGVCHWSLMSVVTKLKIRGNTFFSSLSPSELFAQKTVDNYFIRDEYLKREVGYNTFGERDLSSIGPDVRNNVFKVTLSSKEIMP
jgi:hypothetical protein